MIKWMIKLMENKIKSAERGTNPQTIIENYVYDKVPDNLKVEEKDINDKDDL